MYILYALKLKLWLSRNPISYSFYYAINHTPGVSNSIWFKGETRTLKKPGPHYDYPRAAWRHKGGTWALLETAFTCFFRRMVLRVRGNLSLALSTFVLNELVDSLALARLSTDEWTK